MAAPAQADGSTIANSSNNFLVPTSTPTQLANDNIDSNDRIINISRNRRQRSRRNQTRNQTREGGVWLFRSNRVMLVFWSFGDLIGAFAQREGLSYSLVMERQRRRRANRMRN